MSRYIHKLQSVKRFYFLDYFYILIKSIEKNSKSDKIFEIFKKLKKVYQLGESKYKKLTVETENLTPNQQLRYLYTFYEVVDEAIEYKLIRKTNVVSKHIFDLQLLSNGKKLLHTYEDDGINRFRQELFQYMEKKYKAFHYLINFAYKANKVRNGLLIFPVYSPSVLELDRKDIKNTKHILNYTIILKKKLESDIEEYLGLSVNLDKLNNKLIERLKRDLLPNDGKDLFNPKYYNAILKRIRNYWLDYFLREIYGYSYSLNSFDIWAYRGKQLGIFYITEFFPFFSGRLAYPTSIITDKIRSGDFKELFSYNDENLYIHVPNWNNEYIETFIEKLTTAYFMVKGNYGSYFVNLANVREIVCYNLKISELLFNEFLKNAYNLNLLGKLKINISLEADRLPYETNAMYLKREPVLVNGTFKNIIAIDLSK